jgi:hypothetical protein
MKKSYVFIGIGILFLFIISPISSTIIIVFGGFVFGIFSLLKNLGKIIAAEKMRKIGSERLTLLTTNTCIKKMASLWIRKIESYI